MANQKRAMYELLYVVNTVLNDDQVDDICDRVAGYIRENDGDVIEDERWGSRRLAYPIEKKRNGYYGLVYFRSNPEMIARLDRALRINDDILRHLVLRYDAKMERHFEQRKVEAAKRQDAAEKSESEAEEKPSEKAEAAPKSETSDKPAKEDQPADEAGKEDQPADEAGKEDQPLDEPGKEVQPADEPGKEVQPADEPGKEDQPDAKKAEAEDQPNAEKAEPEA